MTLPVCLTFANTDFPTIDAESQADLRALAAEAMGWQFFEPGAYLHQGDVNGEVNIIHVVGVPDGTMARMNVLLLV